MENFAIDLDKVLDDFEESEVPSSAITNQNNVNTELLQSEDVVDGFNRPCLTKNVDGLLYEPPEALDISDADFAPSPLPVLNKPDSTEKRDLYQDKPEILQNTGNNLTWSSVSSSALDGYQPDVVPSVTHIGKNHQILGYDNDSKRGLVNGTHLINPNSYLEGASDDVTEERTSLGIVDSKPTDIYYSDPAGEIQNLNSGHSHQSDLLQNSELKWSESSVITSQASNMSKVSNAQENAVNGAEAVSVDLSTDTDACTDVSLSSQQVINESSMAENQLTGHEQDPASVVVGENQLRDFLRGKHGPHIHASPVAGPQTSNTAADIANSSHSTEVSAAALSEEMNSAEYFGSISLDSSEKPRSEGSVCPSEDNCLVQTRKEDNAAEMDAVITQFENFSLDNHNTELAQCDADVTISPLSTTTGITDPHVTSMSSCHMESSTSISTETEILGSGKADKQDCPVGDSQASYISSADAVGDGSVHNTNTDSLSSSIHVPGHPMNSDSNNAQLSDADNKIDSNSESISQFDCRSSATDPVSQNEMLHEMQHPSQTESNVSHDVQAECVLLDSKNSNSESVGVVELDHSDGFQDDVFIDDITLDEGYLESAQNLDVDNIVDFVLEDKNRDLQSEIADQTSEANSTQMISSSGSNGTDISSTEARTSALNAHHECATDTMSPCATATLNDRRGSDESVERFLVQQITSPHNVCTPMEDAGMSKVPGFTPGLAPMAEIQETEPITNVNINGASNSNTVSGPPDTNLAASKQPDVKPKIVPPAAGAKGRSSRPNSLLGLSTPDLTPSTNLSNQPQSLPVSMAAPAGAGGNTPSGQQDIQGPNIAVPPVSLTPTNPNIPSVIAPAMVPAAQPTNHRPTSLNLVPAAERPRGEVIRAAEDVVSIESSESSVGPHTPAEPPPANIVVAPPHQAESLHPAAPLSANLNVPITQLGKIVPVWVPDTEAAACMQCEVKFTFTRRRHHCRACGKVYCSTCCNLRSRLAHLDHKEARVCSKCYQDLIRAQVFERMHGANTQTSPNPNEPSEYCSTIPPQQQASNLPPPTVMVPSSALRKQGNVQRGERKTVMFSDGIRPGGDLTEPGRVTEAPPPRPPTRNVKVVEQSKTRTVRSEDSESSRNLCFVPPQGLPPIVRQHSNANTDVLLEENPSVTDIISLVKNGKEPVTFALNKNLFVMVKLAHLDCCVNYECLSYVTRGMCVVNQAEVVIMMKCDDDDDDILLHRDIFLHLQSVFEEASKGRPVTTLGHTLVMQPFMGSRELGGFLYITPTFQCLQKLLLPQEPYLFAILLQKWEVPWAKVFPLRLMLRLGAEFRYYPCPLFSQRSRKPVYGEIGHTIMNLLADFRNYQYVLPSVRGMMIHMEDKHTYILFPRNRYDEVMKVVNGSNEHVMSLGSNFSSQADSHLVCLQNDDGNYQTQAINIQNKARQVTGASFVVFNGALKSSSGLRAKSSIVEDGLMIQISAESLAALKQALVDMSDYEVACGAINATVPEDYVTVKWIDDDKNFNTGVKSPVDNMALEGIQSVKIHNSSDYSGGRRAIRWTQVFFIQSETNTRFEPVDQSRLADMLAQAGCVALVSHLDALKELGMTRIGLRTTIHAENVGYEAGSNGQRLPDFCMNSLDTEMIPVIHGAASNTSGGAVTLELIFHIVEQ